MQKEMTPKEYRKYVEKISPKSKIWINIIKSFFVGGLICVVGQIITNLLTSSGYNKEDTTSITILIMIFLGVFFTAINIYDELGRFSGAGSIIPITGFANSIVSPAMEFKSEGYIMGIGARMFVIAGPVLVYGIISSVAVGVIYYLIHF